MNGNIIMNEKEYARMQIEQRSLGQSPVDTMIHVAKYYLDEGYSKKELPGMLERFVVSCDAQANLTKLQPIMESISKKADKYKLINIDGVRVTKKEMESIRKIKSAVSQRLMFTLLCLAKYGDCVYDENNGWVNRDDSEIFRLANITARLDVRQKMIHDLYKDGYLGYSKIVDNVNMSVRIIDEEDDRSSDPEILIRDFRNLGFQFMRHFGIGKYIECQNCGKVVRINTSCRPRKYCEECAEIVNARMTMEARRQRNLGS